MNSSATYRGRIAPSPTGYLHLGHARTFWQAQVRAQERGGALVLRIEDLDFSRCRPEFVQGMYEDLKWFGFQWDEGPDIGGPHVPYTQSARLDFYRTVFQRLQNLGAVYPCKCSRQDVLRSLSAPHVGDEEPVYPGTCRDKAEAGISGKVSWRFRVPQGERITFVDGRAGETTFVAGKDFGDFIIWRHDGIPSYQLAVVADDHAMGITEVVRGADLLMSAARQILLYRTLGWAVPSFYHCELMTDEHGVRLAKRHESLSLRKLREQGAVPERIRASW